ncbi:MAG: KpsF/GutQ family sugar-phosphate isomerase [Gemmatimonadetes bacterium]|nr:KpsF/GutQ family sugar-phosphate isomerase [Gemmatimonadota bacterium]
MSVNGAGAADLLAAARQVIRLEAEALLAIEARLDGRFLAAVQLIAEARGRVIVSGLGKSGIVARKIAATMTSTGTPAVFLHPVEGMHGDLGIVGREDVAVLLSRSGESPELMGLLAFLVRLGVGVVALTGRPDSTLGRAASVALDCGVPEEACPYDLAPTSSTTAALAMGDALAVALLLRKGFTREEFARFHPGGSLGRKLTLRVSDVMIDRDFPRLGTEAPMRECVVLLAEKRGTVPIVDADGQVVGVVTAGDLTRRMERQEDIFDTPVREVMNRQPKRVRSDELAAGALFLMEKHGIMALPVIDAADRLVGVVHLHDLMRANVV